MSSRSAVGRRSAMAALGCLAVALASRSEAATYIKWAAADSGLDLGAGRGIVEVSAGGDPIAVYAIVDGAGLLRSRDEGLTWTRLSGNEPCVASPYAVTAGPADGRVVFAAGAEGGGLWKSADGGDTWSRAGDAASGMASDDVEWITIHSQDPKLVLVGHRRGDAISVSADGGASWRASRLGRAIDGQMPFIIDDSRWVVAARAGGAAVAVTDDAGASWSAATGKADYFTGPLPVIQADEAFFASSHHGTNKSVDSGRTWTYAMERHARVVGSMGALLFREDRADIRGEKARLLTINMSDNFANSWEDVTGALVDLVPDALREHVTIQNAVDPFAHVRMASAWSAVPQRRAFFLGLGKAGLYRGELMQTAKGPKMARPSAAPISLVEGDTRTSVLLSVMASPKRGEMKRVYADLSGLGRGELELLDDGRHEDGEAGDRVFANRFTMGRKARPGAKTVGIVAEDASGKIESLALGFKVAAVTERMIVWDGDKFASGGGWVAPPGGFNTLKPQTDDAHEGKVALELYADVTGGYVGGGWNWHGWYPEGSGTDVRSYRNVSMWAKVEGAHRRSYEVTLLCSTHAKTEGAGTLAINAADYVLPPGSDLLDGEWHEVVIPLADLYDKPGLKFDPAKAWMMNISTWAPTPGQMSLYLDEIGFDNRPVRAHSVWVTDPEERDPAAAGAGAPRVTARVDTRAEGQPISPYIYGASMGDRKAAKEVGLTNMRAGGNPVTPLNWRKGFASKGADWFYQNDGAETPPEKNWLVSFHRANKEAGLETYLTIPMMGRVAKDGESVAFDTRKYPDQDAWAGKSQPTDPRPHAGSGRQFVKGPDGETKKDAKGNPVLRDIVADPDDTSVEMSPEEQADMLRYMIEDMGYGRAREGGVKYIALDNEPFLWASTHRGMRTKGCSYDEIWQRTRDYASLYKKIDPDVRIACGTFWGWTAYWYSGLDMQLVNQGKGTWDDPPDFVAHGRVPVAKWLLKKLKEHEKKTGERLSDIFDFHFYPQTGIYMGGAVNDPKVMEGRVQETRVMWDPTWKDPTWMGNETGKVLKLIRMMKEWIAEANPGMDLAIGEYNFGGERDVSGGVAQAELLGVFAREGVKFAHLWLFPYVNSSHYFAFKMFRNPDGNHAAFGDTYLPAAVSAPDDVSVHAARDSKDGRLTFVLVNKRAAKGARVTVELDRALPEQKVAVYEYSNADRYCIGRLPERTVSGRKIDIDLPPMSVLRFDVKP